MTTRGLTVSAGAVVVGYKYADKRLDYDPHEQASYRTYVSAGAFPRSPAREHYSGTLDTISLASVGGCRQRHQVLIIGARIIRRGQATMADELFDRLRTGRGNASDGWRDGVSVVGPKLERCGRPGPICGRNPGAINIFVVRREIPGNGMTHGHDRGAIPHRLIMGTRESLTALIIHPASRSRAAAEFGQGEAQCTVLSSATTLGPAGEVDDVRRLARGGESDMGAV